MTITAPITPPVTITAPVVPTTISPALNASTVFIGASIINYWHLPIHNAGIAGQTSTLVFQRFSKDVLNHGYKHVVIQVGSNDILQGVKDPPSTVAANVASMAKEATDAKIDVIVMSLGPITWQGVKHDTDAAAVNARLLQMCTANGYKYVDIYTPMLNHPEYFIDGLHPTTAGYAVMEKALAKVLK